MDLKLQGKVAMVGGASKGLGFAVARALALEGARISMVSRDRAAVDAAASRLAKEARVEVISMPVDLATADGIDRWHAATAQRFGGVDLVFANTGGPPAGPALAFDDAQWEQSFQSLVMSAVRLVRLAAPSMEARGGGAILFGTSSSVKEPIPNLALSNVLRASVAALSKTLAAELAPKHIRVNNLIPGRIATDRLRQLDEYHAGRAGISPEEQERKAVSAIPLGRYGAPDEFGRMAAFLLSDAASYITGASVQVDGGLIRGLL